MAAHQVERQRCLIVAVEIRPVHGNDDVGLRTHQMRYPTSEAFPDVDTLVTEHAINLLDRVLSNQPARLCRALPKFSASPPKRFLIGYARVGYLDTNSPRACHGKLSPLRNRLWS